VLQAFSAAEAAGGGPLLPGAVVGTLALCGGFWTEALACALFFRVDARRVCCWCFPCCCNAPNRLAMAPAATIATGTLRVVCPPSLHREPASQTVCSGRLRLRCRGRLAVVGVEQGARSGGQQQPEGAGGAQEEEEEVEGLLSSQAAERVRAEEQARGGSRSGRHGV
jgi:hypothetical protein